MIILYVKIENSAINYKVKNMLWCKMVMGKVFCLSHNVFSFFIYVGAGLNYPLHYILNVTKVEGEL